MIVLPWGFTHVSILAISCIPVAKIAETELGTGLPCRLKLTTKSESPSGVTAIVAGNMPTPALPRSWSLPAVYFHT